jgi:ABC-2 type transport system ATP-binding protein
VLARVGAMVEEPHFHRHLTGRENLGVIAAVRGPEVRGRIEGALRRVGLADRGNDRVGTYSQGMRQRLGVGRCLLADPELLILDEPMNGLDPGGILEFRTMLAELTGEGRTVFLSSHLLDEVEKTCHAAAIIDRGRIIAQGPISELVQDEHNELDIVCDDQHAALDLLDGHPEVAAAYATPNGLRVTLAGIGGAASINARLVTAGVSVSRLEPVHESLEHRFLEMTSRVGGAA